MDIWENSILWNQGCMGNIKDFGNCCIATFGANRDVYRWIDIHSISDIDCCGNRFGDLFQGIRLSTNTIIYFSTSGEKVLFI